MSWTYAQSTGGFYDLNLQKVADGYSGYGECKNQPGSQQVPDAGPIPVGDWKIIGPPTDTDSHGPFVLRLEPCPGTETFGRSEFLIHGDSKENPGFASRGCIILPRPIREKIWASVDLLLTVVASPPPTQEQIA